MKVFTLCSAGLQADIMTYGATVISLRAPRRDGVLENVVLHYPTLEEYEHPPHPRAYFGATIGRFANRIGGASFALNGHTYRLSANDGNNTLHGGARGFDRAMWSVEHTNAARVVLSYVSEDGDQGFPGTLHATVTFTVQQSDLRICYSASCDADTVVNFTNHSYFDLSGGLGDAAQSHTLQIAAGAYTPVDEQLIPLGTIEPVKRSRYDFRRPRMIGAAYDNNWVLGVRPSGLALAARLAHAQSGRMLEVYTTQPGLQFYSGNPSGIALETQHFPDSPNQPSFPSTVLRRGERFTSTTVYRFCAQ
ncbi:MAG: aldose epimerase family protein [Candidatus Baltobacteraceae bacterium]